jgi:quinoprotein glucose dehydrogenase
MLANPVAFYIDNKGKCYVAETFRHHKGVTDMRGHRSWLVDDLACETIEDRLIAMKKNLGAEFADYSVEHDRVKFLEDTDGDAVMDRSSVFADGFKDTLAGIGSGLLEDRGNVYYTCIPDLWILRDPDGDGVSDERKLLSSGYGVHISLLGHDSHGLRKGPDGRIYFSIGDRGFNVETENGRLEYPHTGAVLRCEPDGSGLEVVHTGLRNPQELVFDNYGNLFTGDNNSDAGDQARWVYIVEGGETGWIINHQWTSYPMSRGIWMTEKMWHLEEEGQAAYYLPPLAHIGSGPSGLAYYDGTGLPDTYRDTFFLCDFRGTPTNSKIHAIKLKNKGAAFEVSERRDFLTGALPTDVDFGIGNGIYFSDWVDGWDQPLKGRLYRIFDPAREKDPMVSETSSLLKEGFQHRPKSELLRLLGHPNQRVRFEAQWALADFANEIIPDLVSVARRGEKLLARIHAIWAMGQIGRIGPIDSRPIIELLSDPEMEIRAQAARVLEWVAPPEATEALIDALEDPSPRVRFLAAIALGKIGAPEALPSLLDLIAKNDNRDRYLRHGGVMGLLDCASEEDLTVLAEHESAAIRLAAVLALRKLESAGIANFLDDPDFFVVAEAARAINDVPIPSALPRLADALDRLPDRESLSYEPLVRRILNAHYRLGGEENALRLVEFAASQEDPVRRAEALMRLGEWGDPDDQDQVVGVWRPLMDRDPNLARRAVEKNLDGLLSDSDPGVRREAIRLVASYRFEGYDRTLFDTLKDEQIEVPTRIESVKSLVTMNSELAPEAIELARASEEPKLRSSATAQLGKLDPQKAMAIFAQVLDQGEVVECQSVFASLGELECEEADELLLTWLQKHREGAVSKEVCLDLLLAAKKQSSPAIEAKLDEIEAAIPPDDPFPRFRPCLYGGDSERGKKVFFENASTNCTRCHLLFGIGGGEVGPDLTQVGARLERETILEAIVAPNRRIAAGFENVTLTLADGSRLIGRVLEEDDTTLRLEIAAEELEAEVDGWGDEDSTIGQAAQAEAIPHSIVDVVAEGKTPPDLETRAIEKSAIVERRRNLSAMPENIPLLLDPMEIRDLVEFLTNLK